MFKDEKEIVGAYKGSKVISAVYKGAKVIWEAIKSPFGKGYWIDRFPWVNKDAWKN